MSTKRECDQCGKNCHGQIVVTSDEFMIGTWDYDFCRWSCLLDYIFEHRMRQVEHGRMIEARLELGLDANGNLPQLRKDPMTHKIA